MCEALYIHIHGVRSYIIFGSYHLVDLEDLVTDRTGAAAIQFSDQNVSSLSALLELLA